MALPPGANAPAPGDDVDAVLRAVVEGVEAATGDEFFRSLVHRLADALAVQYAFVTEFTEDRTAFRTLAVWGRGAFLPNLVVPLAGTPCEAVLSGQLSHHADGLQERFPEDRGLVDWGVVSYCGVPICDAAGVVTGHFAILDDAPMPDGARALAVMRIFAARVRAESERLRHEAALADSGRHYRDLYDEAPAAYLTFSAEGRVMSVNRRASEVFRRPIEQMIGRHFGELLADTPGGKPRGEAMYRRFLAGQGFDDEEHEILRGDGTTAWVRASNRALHDEQGRLQAARASVVDISDQKRAEEALRASEERLARILHSAMDAIVTLDDAGRVELFNQVAERVFGCPAAEAIGRPLDRFLTDGFREALERALRAFAAGKDADPYLWAPEGLYARDGAGRTFAVEATIAGVEVGDRRLHTLILRDVEERRRREEELRQLHRQNAYLQEEIKSVHNFEEIVGRSAALRAVLDQVALVAATDSSVLICGETGTGKELIARAVHSNSRRRDRPLIKLNCAALPAGLIESELFGHEKGAFTGAVERRIGRFELAHGGTIFLDEIGELPRELQAKLLRVLQERELERVGGSTTIKADVRVIAATNRDLAKATAAGAFREDLYYRLSVFPVVLPPLRARREDVPLLVQYFTTRYAAKIGRRITGVSPAALRRLVEYPWPGNVRELENVIERAVILSAGPELEVAPEVLPAAAPAAAAPARGAPAGPPAADASRLEDVERQHIVATLKQTAWRIDGPRGAARLLSLNPSTLRSRMKKLGIRRSAEHS